MTKPSPGPSSPPIEPRDFLRQIVVRDLAEGRHRHVVTRFPPEPNGYLHIGHAKSIVLNFGLARELRQAGVEARCHLRFDDTNPLTEETLYVDSIREDVRWLGYDWGEHLYFASDAFEKMYEAAEELIRKGLAYVDSQPEAAIREGRGTVKTPGTESPHRDRSVEENLDLFRRMRAGEFPDGAHVLRARIDMASPNMLMRDPVLYRIRHASHHRTGDQWCIYPLYDFAHCLEDAFEEITHSFCTLEFENNREIYDWVVANVTTPATPRQYEFARLNLEYTIMSKRKLRFLVERGDVDGWDDPRMPTIAGLRRRGVTPAAIRSFCEMIGVAKADSRVDMGKLEFAIRDDLNQLAPRVLCVTDPLKVTITNWEADRVDWLDAPLFPRDVDREGSRKVPFTRELVLERDDFREEPEPGFRRLVPGGEVRLRYGYIIRCDEVVRDDNGTVTELRCSADLESRGGSAPDGRKVKGTVHWVSATEGVPCTVRLYDRLFSVPDPEARGEEEGDGDTGPDPDDPPFRRHLNPHSLVERPRALVEPSVLEDDPDTRYQFERVGYVWRDPETGRGERPVFNRIVTLRDSWAKRQEGAGGGGAPPKEKPAPRREQSGGPGERPPVPPEVRARAHALVADFGLEEVDAEIVARDPRVEGFYRAAVDAFPGEDGAGPLANWTIHELPPVMDDRAPGELPFEPAELALLVALVEDGTVSNSGGREVLEVLARKGGDPRAIVNELDLVQVSDDAALLPVVQEVVRAHPDKARAWRGGKHGLLGFFMGQVMRATGGKADPERARALLEETLAEGGEG
ncbi:MAG: glutamine--tRNA ligase/YqeY domain fusion protein [Gemmatimonadales bacterium]|nr:MAG: glutamine--tRNA ligase/YqeY domain fusion protein [Gemmatimonadales bacterium]